MMRVFLFCFFVCSVFADKVITPQQHSEHRNPWYTGPLLAPSSVVVPVGHFNFEPYVYVTATTGIYNHKGDVVRAAHTFWSSSFQPVLQVGLTEWMDFQILPGVAYNYINHQAKWVFQDLLLTIDFQLLKPRHIDDFLPYLKLFLAETFPTGKYRNLNPKKLGADVGGGGSFKTAFGLVIGELFHLGGEHFLISRLSLQYELPAPVHLTGLNAYGGGIGTNARFFPSQNFEADLGLEFTLTQNWVLACDFVGTWAIKPHFSGNPGMTALGLPAPLGFKNFSTQYALAPALEYNWAENIGIIGGCWFTVAGRNAARFWSAVIAFNYYYN